MIQYINALESFEKECTALYGEFVMESFAPVGAMESIQEKAKGGWEFIRRIANRIWEFVKEVAGKIKAAVGKISASMRKAPAEASGNSEAAKEAEAASNKAINLLNELKNKLGTLGSLFNKLRNSNSSDEMDNIAAEASNISGSMSSEKSANESFTAFIMAMEADAEEAAPKKKIKINLSGLKSKIQSAGNACGSLISSASSLIGQINQSISGFMNKGGSADGAEGEGESDGGTQTRRQKALSAILRAASWIIKKVESIPAHLAALYGRVFKGNGVRIKEYDGEVPEIG